MAERKTSSTSKKNRLTLDHLKKKTVRKRDIKIELGDEIYEWELTAISSKTLDALQMRYPPKKDQKERGLIYNPEKFGPALLAACSTDPELSMEEAEELWHSEEWSTGEINELFNACINLCMAGFEVNPTETD